MESGTFLDMAEHAHEPVEGWARLLAAETGLTRIDLPFRYLGSTGNTIDVAHDFLEIAFVAERLASLSATSTHEVCYERDGKRWGAVRLTLGGLKVREAAEFLASIGIGFMGASEHVSDEELETAVQALQEQVDEFHSDMFDSELHFPRLGDAFLANYVVGSREVYDEEDEPSPSADHPERLAMFWRSFLSRELGFGLYLSEEDVFVIPAHGDLAAACRVLDIPAVSMDQLLPAIEPIVNSVGSQMERGRECVDAVWGDRRGRAYRYSVAEGSGLVVARCDEATIVVMPERR